jgi:hypothetical protein
MRERDLRLKTLARVCLWLGLLTIIACAGAGGGGNVKYLYWNTTDKETELIFNVVQGETLTKPIVTYKSANDQTAQAHLTAVHQSSMAMEFDPNDFPLTTNPDNGHTNLVITCPDDATLGPYDFTIHRDAEQIEGRAIVVDHGFTMDADADDVPQSGQGNAQLAFLPRGITNGTYPVTLEIVNPQGLTVDDSTLDVAVTSGQVDPTTLNVQFSATAGAPRGSRIVKVLDGTTLLGTFTVEVTTTGGGAGSFTFTCSHSAVTFGNHEFSQWVTFTITSNNGFSGDVQFAYDPDVASDHGVSVEPFGANPLTVTISPGNPAVIQRRFYYVGLVEDTVTLPFIAMKDSESIIREIDMTMHP